MSARFTIGLDFFGAHPDCRYLANSGVRWLYKPNGERDEERAQGAWSWVAWTHHPASGCRLEIGSQFSATELLRAKKIHCSLHSFAYRLDI